jgi:flavin reductase (DIM6/NTAB) family NADH-FMN oxidoreductase RutF
MEPPSMLVCINKEASIHSILSVGSLFCINILSNTQESLSKVCSESDEGESRFKDISWKEESGYVFNSSSLSNVFCECTNTIDHNTHTIFIAEVKHTINNTSDSPLVYMSGKYLK